MKLVPTEPARVVIATPCGDTVQTDYAMSLAQLINWTHCHKPPGMAGLGIMSYRTSLLPASRNTLLEAALEGGFTHILWIDSDMLFPHDTLTRLLAHNVECVGVNARMRQAPYQLTAKSDPGHRLDTNEHSSGLEKVHSIGLGVVLLDLAAVRRIRKRPYFNFEWVANKGVYRGEDFYFGEKLKRAGTTLYVDHDLSKEIGHVGTFGFFPVPPKEGEYAT